MKKLRKTALFLCLLLPVSGCGLLPSQEQPPQIQLVQEEESAFTFTQVTVDTVQRTFTCAASYVPTGSESLGFPIGGVPLSQVFVEAGDVVEAGQLLAELDCEALRDSLDNAEFVRDQYYLQLCELEDKIAIECEGIEDADAIAAIHERYADDREVLELRISKEEAMIAECLEKIAQRQLIAGMSGTITYLANVEEGDTIRANSVVLTISDLNVSAFVVEGDNAAAFVPGDAVEIKVSQQVYAARVAEDMEIIGREDENRAFLVPETAESFATGARAEVVLVQEQRENVLCLRNIAVRVRDGETFVYVLDENGLQTLQPVTLGLVGDHTAEVLSGLEDGDLVLLK